MVLRALVLFAGRLLTSDLFTSNEAQTSGPFLGIGPGGKEHIIVYRSLIWLAEFSRHLVALSKKIGKSYEAIAAELRQLSLEVVEKNSSFNYF